jgi:hypothetical protein
MLHAEGTQRQAVSLWINSVYTQQGFKLDRLLALQIIYYYCCHSAPFFFCEQLLTSVHTVYVQLVGYNQNFNNIRHTSIMFLDIIHRLVFN